MNEDAKKDPAAPEVQAPEQQQASELKAYLLNQIRYLDAWNAAQPADAFPDLIEQVRENSETIDRLVNSYLVLERPQQKFDTNWFVEELKRGARRL